MTTKYYRAQEAVDAHRGHLELGVKSGKWLMVAARVEVVGEEIRVIVDYSSWNFPRDDFDTFIRLIKEQLDENKANATLSQDSLPIADFLKHVTDETAKNLKIHEGTDAEVN